MTENEMKRNIFRNKTNKHDFDEKTFLNFYF